MSRNPPLSPATPDDVQQALAFALRFYGRTRAHDGEEVVAAVVARRLLEHLELSGFVVMRKRQRAPPSPPTP